MPTLAMKRLTWGEGREQRGNRFRVPFSSLQVLYCFPQLTMAVSHYFFGKGRQDSDHPLSFAHKEGASSCPLLFSIPKWCLKGHIPFKPCVRAKRHKEVLGEGECMCLAEDSSGESGAALGSGFIWLALLACAQI